MAESGILELGNTLHMECLWFCFLPVLQDELDNVKIHWNTHCIRRTRDSQVSGVPMCCITYQSAQEAMIAMFLCSSNKLLKWNSTSSMTMMTQEYQEYFYYVMNNKCLQFPSTTSQGKLRKGKFLKENSLQLQTFRPDIFICWIAEFTDQSNRVCVCVCVCVKRKSILSLI